MRWTTLVLAIAVGFLSVCVASATETATFDTEASTAAAGWAGVGPFNSPDPPTPGIDTDAGDVNTGGNFTVLSWLNSANAAGAAGEVGGQFSRSELTAGFADLDLGGELAIAAGLHATGKIYANNVSFDGGWQVGFFDQGAIGTGDFTSSSGSLIGFTNAESGGGFRSWVRAQGENGNQEFLPHLQELNFEIDVPAGSDQVTYTLNDANGALFSASVTIGDTSGSVNAFGLLTGGANAPTEQHAFVYLDDLEYTNIPEPSAIVLAAVALIGLGFYGRRRLG